MEGAHDTSLEWLQVTALFFSSIILSIIWSARFMVGFVWFTVTAIPTMVITAITWTIRANNPNQFTRELHRQTVAIPIRIIHLAKTLERNIARKLAQLDTKTAKP